MDELKKMELRIRAKLRELRVYIPFIDYYITMGRDVEDKFLRMKEWILANRLYSMDVLEKFERSIIVKYRKMLGDDVKIPSNISELFSPGSARRVETIDLCSDGEGGDEVPFDIQPENRNEDLLHKHELSDGEIIDSDTEDAPKRSKKPCTFQIGPEQKKDCDNLIADFEKDSTKNIRQKRHNRRSNSNDDIATTSSGKNPSCFKSTSLSKDKKDTVLTQEKKYAEPENIDPDTEDFLQHIDKIISLSEEKSDSDIECMSISDKSDKDFSFELSCIKQQEDNVKVDNECIENEEQLFTRRTTVKHENQVSPKHSVENLLNTNDFNDNKNDLKEEKLIAQIDLTVKSKKHRKHRKKSKKRRKRSTELPTDSTSDEDNVPSQKDKKLSKSSAAPITCIIALSDTDEPNKNPVIDNISKATKVKEIKTQNENLITDDESLQKLNMDELHNMFSILDSNINLEQFLKECAEAENNNKVEPKPIQSMSTKYEHTKPNGEPYIPIHTKSTRDCGHDASNILTIHPQTAEALPLSIIQQPPLQTNAPQTSTFTAYPIMNINGRKINLNDPRVRRDIQQLLNSPVLGITNQLAANAAYLSHSTAAPKPAPSYQHIAHPAPSTYGEYKRRKALEAEKLRNQAELEKEKKNLEKEKQNLNAEIIASPLENSQVIEETEAPQRINNVRKLSETTKPNTLDCLNSIEKAPRLSSNATPAEHKRDSEALKAHSSLDTLETQPGKSIITNSNDKPETSQNTAKKLSKRTRTMRVLKELECTVIGFDKLKDYLPQSFSGKRKSSESARSAIAKQLNSQQSESTQENSDRESLSKAKLPKRRSSMCLTLEQGSLLSVGAAAPIAKRRRTCMEVNRLSLLNSDTDSADESSNALASNTYAAMPLSPPKDTSSSDTDTFDFNSFRVKKAKALALKNQPYVLLNRLTETEIKRHTRRKPHIQPEQMCLNVELVQASTRAPPPTQTATSSRPKASKNVSNSDKSMTERNTTTCVLCKSKPGNLVNHYIKTHKTEAYVSRLTEKELEELQLNCPFAVLCANGNSNSRYSKYKVQCVFCADELVDNFINFYTHYSTHTGEYGFQCFNCELKKPFRADIQSHQHHAKACRNARIQKQYVYPSDLMVIYLHCCKLCNFVQLNEANVFKHLRDQHNKYGDDATFVQKYIAAAINDAEIVNEVLHSEEHDKETICEEEEVVADLKPDIFSQSSCTFDQKPAPSLIDVAVTSSHMTVIPITNLNTSHITSFLDHKLTANSDRITDDELPRPIVVKMEVKLEENVSTYSPHIEYRYYSQDSACFGLFKCMAADCFFSTDTDIDMLQHLRDHSSSDCPPSSFLECSYCEFQYGEGNNPETLITHIKQQHCCSRFQCPICCYRSCVPGNVAIHCKTIHDMESGETVVYECPGKSLLDSERLSFMLKSMSEKVKKLQCNHCPQGFYATNSLSMHLQQVHAACDDAILDEYACIYCTWNSVQKTEMQNHVALSHPDELAYACRRDLKDSKIDDSINNLMLWNITESVEPMAICKAPAAITVEQSNIRSNTFDECTSIVTENKTNVKSDTLEQQEDLKPTSAQLEHLAEEALRALLNKLTSKTGLPPDRLYHCPIATCGGFFSTHALWSRHMTLRHNCLLTRCPHCADKKELLLSDFEEHFQQHCRHLYVCYHCTATFGCKQTAIAHFQECHNDELSFRFELVKFNFIYSYHIIISTSVLCERKEILQELQANVSNRLEQLIYQEKAKLQCKWLVPLHASWLEDYPLSNRYTAKTCIVKGCGFKTRIVEELFQHWESSHTVAGEFQCSRCPFQIKSLESWQPIMEHVRMHDSTYVCCVCNFNHFGRQQLSAHIQLEHNSRDVPFLSLLHSSSSTYMGVGVVFAANCKAFSTIHTCFCCKANNLSVETLTKHLRKVHNVLPQHYCELCNAPIEQLSEVDAHHNSAHAGSQMKIRFEFLSHDHLQVKSTIPLIMEILSDREVLPTGTKTLTPTISDSITTVDTVNVVGSLDQINIKREIVDDGNESDVSVEIIEDDDLVRAAEFSARRNEQNKTPTEAQKLRCISIKNLCDSERRTATTLNELTASVTQTQSCEQNDSTHLKGKVVLLPTKIAEKLKPIIVTSAPKKIKAPIIKSTGSGIIKTAGCISNPILLSKLQQGQPTGSVQHPPENIQQGGAIETVQYSPQVQQATRVSAQVHNPAQHYQQRNVTSSFSSAFDPVNQQHKLFSNSITVTRIPTQGKAAHNSLQESRNILPNAKPLVQANVIRPLNTQTPLQQIVQPAAVPQVSITASQINGEHSQQPYPSSTYVRYKETLISANSFQPSFSNGLPQQRFANIHPQQAYTNCSQQSFTNVLNQQSFSNVVSQQNLIKALPQQTIKNAVTQQTVINALPQPFPSFTNVPMQRQQTIVQPETTSNTTGTKTYIIFN